MRKIYLMVVLVVIMTTLIACTSLRERKCLTNTEWENMVQIIKSGEVTGASQTHDLCVSIKTKDGKHYKAEEPEIDAIYHVIKDCGTTCSNIIFVTQ